MSKPVYYLIRHGQTDYNAEGRLQGARDIPLNALGKSQAASNGKRLRAIEGFDPEAHEWVASPLLRTRQTMQLVRENAGLAPTEFRTEDRLIEVSFGDSHLPKSRLKTQASSLNATPPNGNSGHPVFVVRATRCWPSG